MKEVKVTVVVPIYNVQKYVIKCLDSLKKQVFDDFEVLAINDGSTDNSYQVVKDFIKDDSRFRLINKENGGYGSVLEMGIKKAEGKYILICDSDDWLAKNALEVLYKKAEKSDLDIVVSDRFDVYVDNNEEIHKSVKPVKITNIFPNKVYKNKSVIEYFSFFDVSPHGKLFKKKLIENITFPKHVRFSDYLLFILGLSHAESIEYVNEPLAYYLTNRPGNTATAKDKTVITDHVKVWNYTFKQLKRSSRNGILYYRMYLQFLFILSEYSKIFGFNFKNKVWLDLLKILKNLCLIKKEIQYPTKYNQNFKNKVLYSLMLTPFLSDNIAREYVFYIRKKK